MNTEENPLRTKFPLLKKKSNANLPSENVEVRSALKVLTVATNTNPAQLLSRLTKPTPHALMVRQKSAHFGGINTI